jgi:dienelactone hydrolase
MHTEEINYRDGDVECVGYLARPDGDRAVPGVLLAHDWSGRGEFVCAKARAVAELGYAGFALDVYGGARLGAGPEENGALMQPLLDDRVALRERLLAGVAAAGAQTGVDGDRLAAMGYCFGGLCVLDLARAGAALRGVISNHGLLIGADAIENAEIRAKVLVLHGHADPMVPPEQVLAFEEEMTAAGADWQVHAYGHTYHAFTNPEANDVDFGTVYNADADRRSWETTVNFLRECFAR